MSALRRIAIAALVVGLLLAFAAMSAANWTPVTVVLPDGATRTLYLPLLLLAAFVAGWLPTWLWHLGSRSLLRRRLTRASETIATAPSAGTSVMPSQAQPTIVPPAGA